VNQQALSGKYGRTMSILISANVLLAVEGYAKYTEHWVWTAK
jgi:hypothetical protein